MKSVFICCVVDRGVERVTVADAASTVVHAGLLDVEEAAIGTICLLAVGV